jgi:hypothetical protein
LTVLLTGVLAGVPGLGGGAWAVLQYILGLRDLGHRVYFVEPITGPITPASEAYFQGVARRFGLNGYAALLQTGTRRTVGASHRDLVSAAGRADLLLNIGGVLRDEALLERVPIRVHLDLDPGFTQLWQSCEGIDMHLDGHTHHATVGLALGTPECPIPTCGFRWIPTLPPVVLAEWPRARATRRQALTTVAHWRGYGAIECGGVRYGQKAHSFRPLLGLPRLTGERFELALAIDPREVADLHALRESGWHLVDPARVAWTPDRYRAWVRGSRAEFGVAKEGYVVGRTGWFSDRSACYLASGRPVLAQDTGFSSILPTGMGLLSFRSTEEAHQGVVCLSEGYPRHSRAAREMAESLFDSRIVLPRLLDAVGGRTDEGRPPCGRS